MALTKQERREQWKERTTETATALREVGATVTRSGKRTVPLSATVVKPGEIESELVKGSTVSAQRTGAQESQAEVTRMQQQLTSKPPTVRPHPSIAENQAIRANMARDAALQSRITTLPPGDIASYGPVERKDVIPTEYDISREAPTDGRYIQREGVHGTYYQPVVSKEDKLKKIQEKTPTRKEYVTKPVYDYVEKKTSEWRKHVDESKIPEILALTSPLSHVGKHEEVTQFTSGVLKSPAMLAEVGASVAIGAEHIVREPESVKYFPVAAGLMATGIETEFKERPFEFAGELLGTAFLPKVITPVVKSAPKVSIGRPKGVIFKATDIYLEKAIKPPIEPITKTTPKGHDIGRLYDPYGPKIETKAVTITKEPTPIDFVKPKPQLQIESAAVKKTAPKPELEFFTSKMKKQTEYGGYADIYLKLPKKQQAEFAAKVAKEYDVSITRARIEGVSQIIVEPKVKLSKDVISTIKDKKQISRELKPLIGKTTKQTPKIKIPKLRDYIRLEKELAVQKTSMVIKQVQKPSSQIAEFAESKVFDVKYEFVEPVKPSLREMGIGVPEFISDTRATASFFRDKPLSVMDRPVVPESLMGLDISKAPKSLEVIHKASLMKKMPDVKPPKSKRVMDRPVVPESLVRLGIARAPATKPRTGIKIVPITVVKPKKSSKVDSKTESKFIVDIKTEPDVTVKRKIKTLPIIKPDTKPIPEISTEFKSAYDGTPTPPTTVAIPEIPIPSILKATKERKYKEKRIKGADFLKINIKNPQATIEQMMTGGSG